ncbi:MAG: hypothetical protein PHW73_01850 [Atribacterota bacterium]|nr:hypothetical protein [Atribacterota bacterium]
MNKCIKCPFKFIDFRKNRKCLLDNKIVNAYGCYRDLSKVIKDNDIDISLDMYREVQDYKEETKYY